MRLKRNPRKQPAATPCLHTPFPLPKHLKSPHHHSPVLSPSHTYAFLVTHLYNHPSLTYAILL